MRAADGEVTFGHRDLCLAVSPFIVILLCGVLCGCQPGDPKPEAVPEAVHVQDAASHAHTDQSLISEEPSGTGGPTGTGQQSVTGQTVTEEELLVPVRQAMSTGRFEQALPLAERLLRQQPLHGEALMHVAVANAELGNFQAAIDHCLQVPAESRPFYIPALCMAGNLLLEWKGRVLEAEAVFEQAFQSDPGNAVARQRLIFVKSLQGKHRESLPLRLAELQAAPSDMERLVSVVQREYAYPDLRMLRQLQKTDPNCGGLWLSDAQVPYLRKDFLKALQRLRTAVQKTPDLVDAQMRLGQVLLIVGTTDDQWQWCRQLSSNSQQHPVCWLVLGQLAARAENWELASDCFLVAADLDPASNVIFYQLGLTLEKLQFHEIAERCLSRARQLQRYKKLLDDFATRGKRQPISLSVLQEGAELAGQLQLTLEQHAWCALARHQSADAAWAQAMLGQLPPIQQVSTAARSEFKIGRVFADRDHPEPPSLADVQQKLSKLLNSAETSPDPAAVETDSAGVSFADVAGSAGLDFVFENGADPNLSGQQWAYDFTGGGMGVIDVDGDNWPDLFLSQGAVLDARVPASRQAATDRLLINLRGQRFADASETANMTDHQYGQGVAVGDFDGDGFQDVFVGNIGNNRLLRNNGDGTFTDVTHAIPSDAAGWTTSCVMADLNQDGFLDLLAVNYLGGDFLTRLCRDQTGRLESCAPQVFPGTASQVFLNAQDGTFLERTSALGFDVSTGKGLGVVVADLTGKGGPDVFVANDGVSNFLFVPETGDEGRGSGFRESGLIHGVALNFEGRTEACMGIAAEDFNGDSAIELFVTNFYEESNTFYHRDPDSVFYSDQTWQTSLDVTSIHRLGFGTQALDVNLDGWMDLMIANGHVDDFEDIGVPYQMLPQLYLNQGDLQFLELAPGNAGAYFGQKQIGRAVARLDWNRDGKDDLVVGHLKSPYALLENRSQVRGDSISLQLSGTVSARNAFGAVATVRNGSHNMVRQLIAGGGYLASNDQRLVFSVPDRSSPVAVDLKWPSGLTISHNHCTAGSQYFAVEGRPVLYTIPR